MNTIYTTTITDEARRRGVRVEVIDAETPIFVLKHGGRRVRCYNALTDRVGAVTFTLGQDKHLANKFLRRHRFRVPDQEVFTTMAAAGKFLKKHGAIVVKPSKQWGGRGVAVGVSDPADLLKAVRTARRFDEVALLEECVEGVDQRLIFVDYRFVTAIRRTPAFVVGNGRDDIRTLIRRRNRDARRIDPSNVIPADEETRRNLRSFGLEYGTVLPDGRKTQVRLTSNYHTGGSCEILESVDPALKAVARRAVRLLELPVAGIDFLVNTRTGQHWIIEVSPDLAISPPEGHLVVGRFMDHLFPETAAPRRAAERRSDRQRSGTRRRRG